jgi:hypothetical protein
MSPLLQHCALQHTWHASFNKALPSFDLPVLAASLGVTHGRMRIEGMHCALKHLTSTISGSRHTGPSYCYL